MKPEPGVASPARRRLELPARREGDPVSAPDEATESPFARGSVTFVGTATVILRYGGFTILTDPNFLHRGDHVHLGYGLTSPRLTEPAFGIEDLPPIDAVVLSHLHGDHFDHLVEARLDRALPIVTTQEAARSLARKGFRATEGLATWDSLTLVKGAAELTITSVPARHAPGPLAALLPKVMGSVLSWSRTAGADPALRFYVSGDTLLREELRQIPQRFPELDWALLHLGGTRLFGVLLTMEGRDGVEAIRWINPRKVIPIHFDDYPVFKSPLSDFVAEVKAAGLEERVVYLARGETHTFTVPQARWAEKQDAPPTT